jgi:hypothetical protein
MRRQRASNGRRRRDMPSLPAGGANIGSRKPALGRCSVTPNSGWRAAVPTGLAGTDQLLCPWRVVEQSESFEVKGAGGERAAEGVSPAALNGRYATGPSAGVGYTLMINGGLRQTAGAHGGLIRNGMSCPAGEHARAPPAAPLFARGSRSGPRRCLLRRGPFTFEAGASAPVKHSRRLH